MAIAEDALILRTSPIGFNLLAWSASISDAMHPITERLKNIGYDGVECFIDDQPVANYQRFGQHLDQLGLKRTTVMTMGPDQNPASESPTVRARAVDYLREAIDKAHGMGATIICGPTHSAFAQFSKQAPQAHEYQHSAEVLNAVGNYAKQAGIVFAVEALNRFECYLCNTMAQLKRLIDLADHPNIRAMFDTHHANIEEKHFPDAIRTIAPVLAHVHISENDRGTPGSGHIPWNDTFKTLAELDYRGWMTIEAFTRNDVDFANSIGVWREYNDPWDIAENGLAFIKAMRAYAATT